MGEGSPEVITTSWFIDSPSVIKKVVGLGLVRVKVSTIKLIM